MLFKRLFIATLVTLACVGCSDDQDILSPDGVTPETEAAYVNVTFSASSGEVVRTKAAGEGQTPLYQLSVPTADVKEYCLKVKEERPEYVINSLTVFFFDANTGKLVKSSYFEGATTNLAGLQSVNQLTLVSDGNSISQFGGILLKEGSYKMILAGNLKEGYIKVTKGVGNTDFVDYQNATIQWTGNSSRDEILIGGYLPMIKIIDKEITLKAGRILGATQLNVINAGTDGNIEVNNKEGASLTGSFVLKRLVARVQLASLKFNWKSDLNPDLKCKLTAVHLANASNHVTLLGKHKNEPIYAAGALSEYLVGGEADDKTLIANYSDYTDGKSPSVYVDNYFFMRANGEDWANRTFAQTQLSNGDEEPHSFLTDEGTATNTSNNTYQSSAIYFYVFPTTAADEQANEPTPFETMLVLTCKFSTDRGSTYGNPVYYYVPIRANNGRVDIASNNVYSMNVTLSGQGSDIFGKKKDEVNIAVKLTTNEWGSKKVVIGQDDPVTPVTE